MAGSRNHAGRAYDPARVMRSLSRRLGIRARMAGSYVLVTMAAVLVVEAIAVAVVIPSLLTQADLSSRVQVTAEEAASPKGALFVQGSGPGSVAGAAGTLLGDPTISGGKPVFQGSAIDVPRLAGARSPGVLAPAEALIGLDGTVVTSSYPARFPAGAPADSVLPGGWRNASAGTASLAGTQVDWAVAPIVSGAAADLPKGKGAVIGWVYVDAPARFAPPLPIATLVSLLQAGAVVLAVTVPVGVLFGLLMTRGLIRRLHRLAAATHALASGELASRVEISGEDEVGRLERDLNTMAERLAASMAEQRDLGAHAARLAERSRISREVHDAISQDLFSMSALVAGLREALPADSALLPQVGALARTTGSMVQETRALLLELRPTALDERRGLAPALAELCSQVEARVGLKVGCDVEPVGVGPAEEHALFRVAQEALTNAARHSDAELVRVRLRAADGAGAELEVEDDGQGFDLARPGHGLGLRLMAERMTELGGTVRVDSEPGRGTRIVARVPGAA